MPRGRQFKFNEEQQATIVSRYLKGTETVSAIAKEYGVKRQTITGILQRHGIQIQARSLSPELEAEVAQRYGDGETLDNLAKEFDVDRKTISSTVARAGGAVRPRGRIPGFATEQAYHDSPMVRLKKLLRHTRESACLLQIPFDDALIEKFAREQPTRCESCGKLLNYSAKHRGKALNDEAPAFDRFDDSLGYTIENTNLLCGRCARIKRDATVSDMKKLVRYIKRGGGSNE